MKKKFNLPPNTNENWVVATETQELCDRVCAVGNRFGYANNNNVWRHYEAKTCLYLIKEQYSGILYFKEEGYTIISAETFLQLNDFPTDWCVKWEDSEGFKKVIEYINKFRDVNYLGSLIYSYYGLNKSKEATCLNKETGTLLTVEQALHFAGLGEDYVEGKTDTTLKFVDLPTDKITPLTFDEIKIDSEVWIIWENKPKKITVQSRSEKADSFTICDNYIGYKSTANNFHRTKNEAIDYLKQL